MKRSSSWKRIGVSAAALIGIIIVLAAAMEAWIWLTPPPPMPAFGATFSRSYAQHLGTDWRASYLALLDDLGIRHIRIPAYWDEIEPQPGEYDFADLDWQIAEASKRGVKVILAVGRKLPRWPECRVPVWAAGLDDTVLAGKTVEMITAIVRRYAAEPSIVAWQIENEPLFWWGDCPLPSSGTLDDEIAAVRAIDGRPLMQQNGGEFSLWLRSARRADRLGISIYRLVWNQYYGYLHRPIPVVAYRIRGAFASLFVDDIAVTELQAEPWFPRPIKETPVDEQLSQMGPERLRDNVEFVRRIGFPEAYFWGVEWWYWVKMQGHPEVWEAAKAIIHESEK